MENICLFFFYTPTYFFSSSHYYASFFYSMVFVICFSIRICIFLCVLFFLIFSLNNSKRSALLDPRTWNICWYNRKTCTHIHLIGMFFNAIVISWMTYSKQHQHGNDEFNNKIRRKIEKNMIGYKSVCASHLGNSIKFDKFMERWKKIYVRNETMATNNINKAHMYTWLCL